MTMLRIQALYDFSAVDQDQLSVRAGDILYVIQRKQQWYYASTNPNAPFSSRSADAGLVPANYFEELHDNDYDDDDEYYDDDEPAGRRAQGRNNSISASESASQVAASASDARRRLGPNRYSDESRAPAPQRRPSQPQASRAPPAYDSDITLLGTVLEPIQGGALLLAADADEMVTVVDVLAKRGMVRARLAASGTEGLIRWNKLRVWEMESGTVISDIYEAAELFAESIGAGQDDAGAPPRPASRDPVEAGRSTPRNEYVPPKATAKAAARAARSSPASSEEGGPGPLTRSPSPTNRRYLNPPPAPRAERTSDRSMPPSARSYSPGPPSASLGRSRSTPLSANPSRSATPLGRSATLGRQGTLTPIRTGTPGRSPTLARTLVGGGSMDSYDSPMTPATPDEMVPRHATLTRGVPAAMLDQTESYSNLRKRTAPVDDLAYSAGVKVAGTGNGGGASAGAMVSDITLVKGTKLAPAQYSYTLRVATKSGGAQEVTKKDAEFYALVDSWALRLPAGTPLPSLPPALTIGAENNYKQCMVLPAVVAQREKEFAAFCKRLVEVQDVTGGAELVAEFCGLMAPATSSGGGGAGAGGTMGRGGGGGGGGMTMGRRPSAGMSALAGGVMRMNLDDGRVPTARVGMGRR